METTFASFEPLPSSPSELLAKSLKQKDKHERREQILATLGEVEKLKSDYLGVSDFFYSRRLNIVYEFDNGINSLVKPSANVEAHIRKINNI
jgi:hypothetical protein